MFTMAAPSRTTASTEGRSNVVLTSTHAISSDFCTVRILPLQESAGGLELFSCLKNSSRFPSLAWQAIYSLEKSRQPLLRSVTRLLVLLEGLFSGVPNKGRLQRCIVSVTGLDRLLSRSPTYLSYIDCPFSLAPETASTTRLGAISLLSNTRRSILSSLNGFPISSITLISEYDVFLLVTQAYSDKVKKIRVLPTGVEPMTFRLVLRMLYH